SMASKLLTEFKSMIQRTDERRLAPAPRLTDRELEVLKLVATGMNNRDIAKELFISENTVKNHVRNILEKLQLHSRMEAVVYAMREKLLDIPSRRAAGKSGPSRGTDDVVQMSTATHISLTSGVGVIMDGRCGRVVGAQHKEL